MLLADFGVVGPEKEATAFLLGLLADVDCEGWGCGVQWLARESEVVLAFDVTLVDQKGILTTYTIVHGSHRGSWFGISRLEDALDSCSAKRHRGRDPAEEPLCEANEAMDCCHRLSWERA